ncbi:MAG TPA: DciA family protein [Caulobacteraceae bacterium]|nr:DciA family protein [Caulobacteraceae bacterium]
MRRRPLPTAEEAHDILSRRRTRPTFRPAPPAGKALSPLIKELDARFGQGPGLLQARWREIVGEQLARHTEPVKIIKSRTGPSTLELKVAGPAAALIQHQAPQIMERVNLLLGAGTIGRLRIVQGVLRPRESAAPLKRRGKGPLDAASEKALVEPLAAEPDTPLKAALIKLGREVLRGR